MIADKLLERLEKVKSRGPNSWLACCPAHEDKSPSMTITERDDRVLIHCFGGCSVGDILFSTGLEIEDLFPERIEVEGARPIKKERFPAEAVLEALVVECLVLELALMQIADYGAVSDVVRDRARLASSRFTAGVDAGGFR